MRKRERAFGCLCPGEQNRDAESVFSRVSQCVRMCVKETEREREEETVSEKVVSQTQSGLRKEFD